MTKDDLAKCREVAQFWREFHARNRIWSGAVTAQVIDDLCAEVAQLEALIAYIDAHAPRADATCDEPGITLSEAARRAMSEAQP